MVQNICFLFMVLIGSPLVGCSEKPQHLHTENLNSLSQVSNEISILKRHGITIDVLGFQMINDLKNCLLSPFIERKKISLSKLEKIKRRISSYENDDIEFITIGLGHLQDLVTSTEEKFTRYINWSRDDADAQMKVDILQFLNTKVAGIERQIEMQPAFTQEDIDNKEFTLKLIDFVQKKLDDKQKGD